ncbi:MAG: EAL domain-containing protein (putative c-di-GMP-specific phosphodiesterase class I) [Planctomycetota bacterium]|jgi:EAL domain-containing protein (putative c-di-GMP-specific phosphodiesterase class I)
MAKESGRRQVQILDIEDERVKRGRNELLQLNIVLNAIDESRFILYFQNIVHLQGQGGAGKQYEILVRMNAENDEILCSDEFMPLIEQYHLSSNLDKWVMRDATDMLTQNLQELEKLDLCLIKLSTASLKNESFRLFALDLVKENPLLGQKLCFEISETAVKSDIGVATGFINELKKYHVRFALDDFGAGHSSLEKLDSLPVDYIKIDGAYVNEMLNNPCDMATVKSIAKLGCTTAKALCVNLIPYTPCLG